MYTGNNHLDSFGEFGSAFDLEAGAGVTACTAEIDI
jgi:hypothetical protein